MGDPDLETLVRLYLAGAPPSEREIAFVRELLAYGFDKAVPENLRKNARRDDLKRRLQCVEDEAARYRAELARL